MSIRFTVEVTATPAQDEDDKEEKRKDKRDH